MIRKMLGELLFTEKAKRLIDTTIDPFELQILLSLYAVYIKTPVSISNELLIIGDYPISFSKDIVQNILVNLGLNLDIYEVVETQVFRSMVVAIQHKSVSTEPSNTEGSS